MIKKIYLFSIIVVVLLAFFLLFIIQKRNSKTVDESGQKIIETAIQKNNEKECEESGENKNECFYNTALVNKNFSLCSSISDKDLNIRCEESRLAEEAQETNLCLSMSNGDLKFQCLMNIFYKTELKDLEEKCNSLNNAEKDLCLSVFLTESGKKEADTKGCGKIVSADLKNNCIDTINHIDYDNDGILNGEEKKIGTDPKNPDTDADGFKDGEEIKKQYNPLGAGKIIF